jgi:CheY-like chemotaxis protein
MSHSTLVMIIDDGPKNGLQERLFEMGFTPFVKNNINDALDRIRHEGFAMLIINKEHPQIDALELVLNVRDFDREIPIFIFGVGSNYPEDRILKQQHNVFLVDDKSDKNIKDIVQRILD